MHPLAHTIGGTMLIYAIRESSASMGTWTRRFTLTPVPPTLILLNRRNPFSLCTDPNSQVPIQNLQMQRQKKDIITAAFATTWFRTLGHGGVMKQNRCGTAT